MKRFFAFLLILMLTGCSRTAPKVSVLPTPTPEMLIQKNTVRQSIAPTPTEYPIFQTMTASALNPVQTTPVPEYHQPQNIYSPTPAVCRIKGNINSKGEKIYHCPNWRDYDNTEIISSEGDRYFCSEAEAQSAGFRRPKNLGIYEICRP